MKISLFSLLVLPFLLSLTKAQLLPGISIGIGNIANIAIGLGIPNITIGIGLPSGCFGFKVNEFEQTFYVHFIRTATNSTLQVSETPITGLARQFPPYSFAYTFTFSRKLTTTPLYTSTEIGRLEGYASVPESGEEFIQGDLFFPNTTRNGYYTIQGLVKTNQGEQKLAVTGGVEGFYYTLGQIEFVEGSAYGGNNFVVLCKAKLYQLNLC